MQLEDYFETDQYDWGKRIRLKGTRLGIEHILEPYRQGESPERIFQGYRQVLTLEQVYATITFYLHQKKETEAYLEQIGKLDEEAYQAYLQQEPSEVSK